MLIYHVSVSHNVVCMCIAIESRHAAVALTCRIGKREWRMKEKTLFFSRFLLGLFLCGASHTSTMAIDSTPPYCCIRVDVFENRYAVHTAVAASKWRSFHVLLSLEANRAVFVWNSIRCCFFFCSSTFVQQMITSPMALSVRSYPHCNACDCWLWCCCWLFCQGTKRDTSFSITHQFSIVCRNKRHKSCGIIDVSFKWIPRNERFVCIWLLDISKSLKHFNKFPKTFDIWYFSWTGNSLLYSKAKQFLFVDV